MKTLLITLGFLLFPHVASAAALSPWVQAALDRTDMGIALSGSFPLASSCDREANDAQIVANVSAVREERRIAIDYGFESQLLKERTLCFEHDRLLFRKKLDDIHVAMNAATTVCNIKGSIVLQTVYSFTLDAYRMFLRGSTDSSFSGELLRYHYPFESAADFAVMQEPELDPASTAPMCPYTTDYSPHFIGYLPPNPDDLPPDQDAEPNLKTYGCDASVLARIRDNLPPAMQTEADDLRDFLNQSNILASDIFMLVSQAIQNIQEAIAAITGAPNLEPLDDPATAPPHATEVGCLLPPSPEPSDGAMANASSFFAVLSAFPDYFRPSNRRKLPSGEFTYTPVVGRVLPIGALFRMSYDFFFTMPSALIVSRAFDDRKGDIGADRPTSPELLLNQDEMQSSYFYKLDATAGYRMASRDMERQIGAVESIFRDSYERTLEAVSPLEAAVKSVSDLTEGFLPNEYIPSVAYFLRRSCVDGHCNTLLDAIAQRSFNPYCHPYVSGRYTDEQAADKCFCRGEYANDDFCKGQQSPPGNPAEIRCGELPPPALSSSSQPGF